MEKIDSTLVNFPFSEISEKEVKRMAGRKKFLGDYKSVNFMIPEEWIPYFELLKDNDPKLNNNKIIREALKKHFTNLPELRKRKSG